jgi:aminoglycoside phosphotransferase (APT) family kinase protein
MQNISAVLPNDAQLIKISNISKLSGGVSNEMYSFSIIYLSEGRRQIKNLVMKIYVENKDPILQMDLHGKDVGKCLREYEILTSLERVNFPVPHVYIYKDYSKFFNRPFIIMDKMESRTKNINVLGVERFATILARLHKLRLTDLGLKVLKPPPDRYEFAKRQIVHFENLLDYLAECQVDLRGKFYNAINWLRNNYFKNPCDEFSLVHGDFAPGNVFLTSDRRIVVTDWEWVDIGDPAYDVGYSYHYIKILTSEKIAQNFISIYMEKLGKNLGLQRIEFYKVVAAIKLSIFYHAVISNPRLAFRYYGTKGLLAFPLLPWFFKKWLSYLNNFLVNSTNKNYH